MTMIGGVASLEDCPELTQDRLIDAADARLYRAKEMGRNRVVGPSHDGLREGVTP